MNTVQIGNDFEDKSYEIIEKILNNKDLSLIPEHCKIFRKKKYHAQSRANGIIFDLSIEVTPPNSESPTLLYLIECKKYSSTIPVDEVALFAQYISEIKNFTVKGVFITNSKLQKGALEQIKYHGMMLIEVDENNYNISHYKSIKATTQKDDYDTIILKALCNILLPKKIDGLQKLSKRQIDNIVSKLISDFNPTILQNATATPLFDLLDFLNKTHNLQFEYSKILDNSDNEVLGYFNSENTTIYINPSIKGTKIEPFVIGHEIGHFILHRHLKINEVVYNNFQDTSFNLITQSFKLDNPKNWIEWQANHFSSCLLLPETSIKLMLVIIQLELGISKTGSIFLDEQECNKNDFREITRRLAIHFETSKISIEYRLNSLKLINRPIRINKPEENNIEDLRALSILRANRDNI
ncbi:ImmA/IrrE family metallo-endopeptidase [Flavobacterium sp. JP2137]|uniref:ImmA/IrrE family metallo-endopeptidase n=1 Tax=Flavobacterium sp. JP2137 TaxID=3414510 RepID=UPI003D2FF269